ncbi:MAG: peptidyl-prolyl cis-trans isomerase [Methylohalobius sp.]|nr:peptidyl-prolyl cis-trans isomerase [Methylohalobius sp.]
MRALGWLFLSLCFSAQAIEDPILAEVDGQKITASQVRAYVKTRPLLSGYLLTGYPGWRQVLEDLINLYLLNLEGKRLGIPKEAQDDEDSYALRIKRQLLPPCEKPDENEAKRFYEDHPELFSTPAFVRLDRIELPASSQVDGKEALAFLEEAAARVRQGQEKLSDLADRCPQGRACFQDLGFVRTDGLASLNDAALAAFKNAQTGEVVGPLQVGEWVYLYQVTARREPIRTPWKQVKAEAAEVAQSFCKQQAFAKLKSELYRRYRVVLYEETLRAIR